MGSRNLQKKLEQVGTFASLHQSAPLCSCLYCPWANSQYVLYKVSWDIHLSMGHLRHNLRVPARRSLSSAPVKVRKVPTSRSYRVQCNLDLVTLHLFVPKSTFFLLCDEYQVVSLLKINLKLHKCNKYHKNIANTSYIMPKRIL